MLVASSRRVNSVLELATNYMFRLYFVCLMSCGVWVSGSVAIFRTYVVGVEIADQVRCVLSFKFYE